MPRPTRRGLAANQGVAGAMQPPPATAPMGSESFIANYQTWSSFGNRRALNQNLGARGEAVPEVLPQRRAKFEAAVENPENSADYRKTAQRHADVAGMMTKRGLAVSARTETGDIAGRYEGMLTAGIQRGAADRAAGLPHATREKTETGSRVLANQGQQHDIHTPEGQHAYAQEQRLRRRQDAEIPGTGWYFDQRRAEAAALPSMEGMTKRQGAAMGARLSSGKNPEDEMAALGGIADLKGRDAHINGVHVSDMHHSELAGHAASAASWSTYAEQGRRDKPDSPMPNTDPETFDALRRAGRAHTANVSDAIAISRGELGPSESFGDQSPKTSAYGEMKFQSDPMEESVAASNVEHDYRNVSAHIRDVTLGLASADQGMFQFSQPTPDSPLHHTLASDVPTAIDTWMMAAGSGQAMAAKPKAGGRGRTMSPAKRMVDKNMPLDPTLPTKESLGMPEGNAQQTSNAAISAQHNEAIRQVSENRIGAVSFNQHGQGIFTPSSLVQEGVWTEGRRQAEADPDYSARTQLADKQGKARKRLGLEQPHAGMSSQEEHIQRSAQSDPNPSNWMKKSEATQAFGSREYELSHEIDTTPGSDNSSIPKRLITPLPGDGTRKSKRGGG